MSEQPAEAVDLCQYLLQQDKLERVALIRRVLEAAADTVEASSEFDTTIAIAARILLITPESFLEDGK